MPNTYRIAYLLLATCALALNLLALIQAVRSRTLLQVPRAAIALLVTVCVSQLSAIYFRIQAAEIGGPLDERFYATSLIVVGALISGYFANRELAHLAAKGRGRS